jgi:serine/threonine-protein kinase
VSAESRPDPDPLEGTPYRSIRLLGRGGMGVVVEAEHRILGKRVAVKVLAGEAGKPASAMEQDRLRVEAEALGRISSPHVVTVSDIGTSPGGELYVVMELLKGRSLAEEIRERGRLPEGEAIAYALHVLRGLSAAHAIGVVHRDLKPANVYICAPFGKIDPADPAAGKQARLLDFGVAKVLESSMGPRPPEHATAEGMVLGTPRFLSPEHLGVADVDERTDVYGAGLLLYVMLTGRGPFDGETGMAGFARATAYDEPPPPSKFAPVSREIEGIVLKCLKKKKAERFRSVDDVIQALGGVGKKTMMMMTPPPARPTPSRQVVTEFMLSPGPAAPPPTAAAPAPAAPAQPRTEMMLEPPPRAVLPFAEPPRAPAPPARLDPGPQRSSVRQSPAFWVALLLTLVVGALLAWLFLRAGVATGGTPL